MRLKSYLRGIGIGILVTAAVFIVSGSGKKNTMTDAQVIARAKELGMVEASTTLTQPTHTVAQNSASDDSKVSQEEAKPTEEVKEEAKPTEEVKEEAKPTEEVKEEVKPTEEVKEEAKPTEEVKEEAKPTEEVKEETKPTEEVKEETKPTEAVKEETKPTAEVKEEAAGDYIVIVVNSGDGSGTVSRKLFEAGIVDNAAEYDRYLMTNGYDKTITVGNHKISINASDEEIAKNLTSKVK